MLAFHPQMFVRVEQLEGPRSPVPRPLDSGFREGRLYRVLGLYSPSETSDAYFILANDRDELWFICQRHLRFAGLYDTAAHHLPGPDPLLGSAAD
ncbi:hypothetical protein RDMS_06515 [Deinococcus sp. RL]|uniref:hypothetical protein n=1 Tax=Deinococcus sp. RL TaxID=1489678 RepID=UPI0004D83925|nr:hypothetical protein [Deinococcus sp. RL]KEF34554.1 hypothetical protein RDMS_06515 [Deinococcus sp. RL]